ncbi:MAG: peptidoglycan-N-acetylglucosamine deacetylase [Thermoleophilaceae bacterium]|nr:peptidoglycan-N-acetylglucosamine deacetylase [Thermoleophilaceae bacterium]
MLPAAAAALVALVALVGGGPDRPHHGSKAQIPAGPKASPRRLPATGQGPAPLTAGPARTVKVPQRLVGRGPFMTVRGGAARLGHAPHRRGRVALTFDDGPGPQTASFLHRLVRLHAKATFFVVGYAVNARPQVLLRERQLGMAVGNHSWSHPPMRSLRGRAQRFQIRADEDAIQRVLGYRPLFFRPPDLSFNLLTAREIEAAGMVGALYTVDPRDWMRPGVRTIVRRALRVRPGGVIALHDAGGDRRQTLAALGPIVRGLRKRHLEPVTLDELYRPSP